MLTMYPPQNNGPKTYLATAINEAATQLTVLDSSVFPEPPNLLTLGADEDAEVVLLTQINQNIIIVERAFDGTTAKAWDADTPVYRAIAAYDVRALQENLGDKMSTEEYDADEDGVVDDAANLGGNPPGYYQQATDGLDDGVITDADELPIYNPEDGHRKATWGDAKTDTANTLKSEGFLTAGGKTAQGTSITLTDVIPDSALTSIELYGKSTQDGTPSPDAPVEIVSQDVGGVVVSNDTVSTTYTVNKTLRGIPVDTDGNYTDENGQQWICDTYNVATGEYVQRVKRLVLDGTETIGTGASGRITMPRGDVKAVGYVDKGAVVSTHYTPRADVELVTGTVNGITSSSDNNILIGDTRYTNNATGYKAYLAAQYAAGTPVIVDYALAEPIVTKVPANYILAPSPTCNILAGGAQMEVEYNNVAGGAKRVYFVLSDPGPREIPFTWAEIQAMVQAGDFSELRVGDYKDIVLSGDFYDAATDTTKTLNSAICRMELAGPDSYYRFGDTAVPHHADFISHDCIPGALFYNATATNAGGFIGSMLHTTLNGENGIQALLPPDVAAVIIEKRALCETKTAADATGWAWNNLGKLWLPSEFEVWGGRIWAEPFACAQAVHYPIFNDGTLNHIVKGDGHNGSRVAWWCASSAAGSAATFCGVSGYGRPSRDSAANSTIRVPLCFRVA